MELEWANVSLAEADGSRVLMARFGPCVLEIHEKNGTWTSAVSWGEHVVDTTGRFTSELAKQRAISMAFLTCPVIPRRTLWDDDSYPDSIGVKNMSNRAIKVRYADVHEGVVWRWTVYRSDSALKEFENFMDAIAYAESVVLDTTRIAEIGTVRVRTESEVAESVMKQYIQRIETERDEAVSRAEEAEDKLEKEEAAATWVSDVFRTVILNPTKEQDEAIQEIKKNLSRQGGFDD